MQRIKIRYILVVMVFVAIVLIINSLRISNTHHRQLSDLLDSIPTYQGAIIQGITKNRGGFPEGYTSYEVRFVSDEKVPKVLQFYHDYFIENGWEEQGGYSDISALYQKNISGKVNQVYIFSNPNFGDKNLYSISVQIHF